KAQGIDRLPFIWFWPEGASTCIVMTHDVEAQRGYDYCSRLMDVDDTHRIKASFQVVPEGRYKVKERLLNEIRSRQFEVNVQDLNHDGHLFAERQEFIRRVHKINQY